MPVILPQSVASNSMDYTTTNNSILLQIIVVYHEKIIYTAKCDILQQYVIINYPTTNCNILLQNIVVYHEKMLFYYKMWYFTTTCGNYIGYTITNSSILLQSYHKI